MSKEMNPEANGTWHRICRVEDIPRMGGRTVRVDQMEVAIFRLSDNRIRAVDNRCPHQQGPLADGMVSGETIICPMHARKISLESGEMLPPDSGCVKTWPTKVEDGQVLLDLN